VEEALIYNNDIKIILKHRPYGFTVFNVILTKSNIYTNLLIEHVWLLIYK